MIRAALAVAAALGIVWGAAPPAGAGQGPETTLVVVNAASPSSLRVANEYARMRRIPATHLCFLDDVPPRDVIGVDEFRERIWKPVKAFLEANGLVESIDAVAYSADFPYGVDFAADKAPPYAGFTTAIASLTSMTYMAAHVEAKDAASYLYMGANGYYRRARSESFPPRVSRNLTEAERGLAQAADTALRAKDYAKAVAAYETLLATAPELFDARYNEACCLALTGKPNEAMAALEKAFAAGWSDAEHTRADDDLKGLRDREDFKTLVARMEAEGRTAGGEAPEAPVSHGFRNAYAWHAGADPELGAPPDSRDRYRLSVLLGYTGERGNSVPEILSYLGSAAASDGTHPKGTVYFLRNGDIRATTREPRFADAAEALRAMGRRAEILSKDDPGQTGVLPVGKDDVLGAVVGIAGFSWPDSKSRLLPGSIAEHLTSCGAQFHTSAQTKISEFLRNGAAGSSGAVAEPYALPWKFPVPWIHVHYAQGCSLAEAFYESVWGPYQLLIVGDPLARPFADFAEVTGGFAGGAPCSGKVSIVATAAPKAGQPAGRMELWVDGRRVAEAPPGAAIEWDTTTVDDGVHELRHVYVDGTRIETRSFAQARATVSNAGRQATIVGPKAVALGETISLSGRAAGAKEVEVVEGFRVLATAKVSLDAWKATVPSERLGMGTVFLAVRATFGEGPRATSAPLEIRVDAPAQRKAAKSGGASRDGATVLVTGSGGKAQEIEVATLSGDGGDTFKKQVEAKAKGPLKDVTVDGEFEAKAAGLYQLEVRTAAAVSIDVDGKPAAAAPASATPRRVYALVSLAAGWHALRLKIEGSADLDVLLAGDQVAAPLAGKSLRHGK